MAAYCVDKNAQANGGYEVHKAGCPYMPALENRMYLGDFASCHEAVRKAMESYPKADGCFFCSKECHKS